MIARGRQQRQHRESPNRRGDFPGISGGVPRVRYRLELRCLLALVGLVMASGRVQAALPEAAPASLGFDAGRLKRIDGAIDRAIEHAQVPGAVVLVGRRGAIVYARAAGRRGLEPRPEPMTRDTVFDLASLTKPVVTATAVMILAEEGQLRLADRVVRTLPELDNHGKGAITIEHLLRHRGGLIPDNPLVDYEHGPEAAWKRIGELELVSHRASGSATPTWGS